MQTIPCPVLAGDAHQHRIGQNRRQRLPRQGARNARLDATKGEQAEKQHRAHQRDPEEPAGVPSGQGGLVIAETDQRRNAGQRDQRHQRPRTGIARIIEQHDEMFPECRQQRQQQHEAARQRGAHDAHATHVPGTGILERGTIKRDHHAGYHRRSQHQRKAGQKERDVVDAQLRQRQQARQDRLVTLRDHEAHHGRRHDPFAETHQFGNTIRVPPEPVCRARHPVADHQHLDHRPQDQPDHQRPGRFQHGGQHDGDDRCHRRGRQFHDGQATHLQMTVRGLDLRGQQAIDHRGGSRDGQEPDQFGHPVEGRRRHRQDAAAQPQDHPTDGLHGKGRVQEGPVVAPSALQDGRCYAHVRKVVQALDDDHDQGHQAENLGEQETGQYQVRGQADRLDAPEADHRQGRAAEGPLGKPLPREQRSDHCAHGRQCRPICMMSQILSAVSSYAVAKSGLIVSGSDSPDGGRAP